MCFSAVHLFAVVEGVATQGHVLLLPRPPSQLPLKQLQNKPARELTSEQLRRSQTQNNPPRTDLRTAQTLTDTEQPARELTSEQLRRSQTRELTSKQLRRSQTQNNQHENWPQNSSDAHRHRTTSTRTDLRTAQTLTDTRTDLRTAQTLTDAEQPARELTSEQLRCSQTQETINSTLKTTLSENILYEHMYIQIEINTKI